MKVVFTASVMDCLHEGHVNLLKKMAEEAGADGKVGVILHDDKSTFENKGRFPVQSFRQRVINLKKSGLVDLITETRRKNPGYEMLDLLDLAKETWGNDIEFLYMRGDDWQDFPGRKVLEEFGVPIKFVKYTKGVSTTQIRKGLTK